MRRLLLFVAAMWMMCLELQADNVNYVECKWENEKLVKSNKTHDATPLSKVKMDGDWMTLTNGRIMSMRQRPSRHFMSMVMTCT